MTDSGRDTLEWPMPSHDEIVGVVDLPLADSSEPPMGEESLLPHGFVEWFVVLQTAIPALLYLPGTQAFRLPLRVGTYGIALFGFGVWWFSRGGRRGAPHPAEKWLVLSVACLGLMIFHPLTSSPLAGVAQTLLYFSVMCPVFWAPGWVDHPRKLQRILAILLVCNAVNSVVGVLQVYDPDRWMPRELSFVFTTNRDALATVSYVGRDGRLVVRPPGLFDTPGAVCGPGTIAALLGLVFCLEPAVWWKRAVAFFFALAGISAIYLSHVRASLVVLLGMMTVYVVMLAIQNQKRRMVSFAALAGGILLAGLVAATALGGESVMQRFSTLFEDDPRSVYYANRGLQVEYAFTNLLTEYPFGAGLGRWGMMRGYFGDPANLDSSELWAEVQPNAWILDGGVFLLVFYAIALVVTVSNEWTLVRRLRDWDDRLATAAVAATNLGTLALVFTFVPFTTQVGLQFWFLEGALVGAMNSRYRIR